MTRDIDNWQLIRGSISVQQNTLSSMAFTIFGIGSMIVSFTSRDSEELSFLEASIKLCLWRSRLIREC
jgi:hypothetical protein